MTKDDMALGFVNQGDLPLLYSAADVVLVPSFSETWGLVVNEALAAGTPVVASTGVTSALEIMAASDSGRQTIRVAQSDDFEGLADGVETLLKCDREEVALQAAAAVAPFDVTLAAQAIAERLERDRILYGRAKQ